ADMGVKSVVTYAENTDYGIGQAQILGQMLQQLAPNVSYVYHVIDRQANDYTPVLLPLRRNPPEMIVTIALPPYGYRLVNQLYELGIAPSPRTWLFEGAGISDYPDFWSSVGPAAESMLALGFYHPDMQLTEMGDAVVAEYMRRHGGAPSRLVLQAADALLVIARAIEAAGSTDRQAVIQAMGEVAVEGTRGTMTFPQAEDPLFQQWTDIPYVVYQFTQVDQTLEKATLIMGPGQPLDVGKLQRP